MASHHVAGSNIIDLDVLLGIEVSTVLDGIQEHLAKSDGNISAFAFRQICNLVEKLHEAFSGLNVAAYKNLDEFGCCAYNLDAIVPAGAVDCIPNHVREFFCRVWAGKITEGTCAHGGDDVGWRAVVGQNDQVRVRTDSSDIA